MKIINRVIKANKQYIITRINKLIIENYIQKKNYH